MTRNIPLKFNDGLLTRAGKSAVEADRSPSAWVADLMGEILDKQADSRLARRRALARMEKGFQIHRGKIFGAKLHER